MPCASARARGAGGTEGRRHARGLRDAALARLGIAEFEAWRL
jgi:hypothetical protein